MTAPTIPDPATDTTGCLTALARVQGDAWVFHLIGAVADPHGSAGPVRVTLASRMVDAEMRVTGDPDEARLVVAERLGYHGKQNRGAFYKILRGTTRQGAPIPAASDPGRTVSTLDAVPHPAQAPAACLFGLADLFGDEWVFVLVGRIRDHKGPGAAGAVRGALADRMVDAEMTRSGSDRRTAVRVVGLSLGYTAQQRGRGDQRAIVQGNGLSNFAKLTKGLTKSGKPLTPHPEGRLR